MQLTDGGREASSGAGAPADRSSTVRIPSPQAGNTEFNCLLWMPPEGQRAGDILLVDSTNFTTCSAAREPEANFWRNLAGMRVHSPAENVLKSFG